MSFTSQKKNILKRTDTQPPWLDKQNISIMSEDPQEKVMQRLNLLEKRLKYLEDDHQVFLDCLEQEDTQETMSNSDHSDREQEN